MLWHGKTEVTCPCTAEHLPGYCAQLCLAFLSLHLHLNFLPMAMRHFLKSGPSDKAKHFGIISHYPRPTVCIYIDVSVCLCLNTLVYIICILNVL